MKKVLLTALALMTTSTLYAERDVLIEHTDKWNLFSKFDLDYAQLNKSGAALGGVTVGGLINDKLGLGIAGRTLIGSAETESEDLQDIENTGFWYAGAYTEYVINPDQLAYWSLDLLIGGGGLSVEDSFNQQQSSTLFVIEPGVNVMVNVTETFMLGAGLSYRLINGVDVEGLGDSDLSGFAGRVFLRFTQF